MESTHPYVEDQQFPIKMRNQSIQSGNGWQTISEEIGKPLIGAYLRSIIRLMSFSLMLEEDHPCVLDEIIIFQKLEEKMQLQVFPLYVKYDRDWLKLSIEINLRKLAYEELKFLDPELKVLLKDDVVKLDFAPLVDLCLSA